MIAESFSQQALADFFDHGTLFKGVQYALNGAVTDLSISAEKKHVELSAKVKGSKINPYTVSAKLIFSQAKLIEIEDQCSCPVGFSCKHVAAALFQLGRNTRAATLGHPLEKKSLSNMGQKPFWDTWLSNVAESAIQEIEPILSEFLIYVIREEKHSIKAPHIFFCVAKKLKSGGLSKPKSFTHSAGQQKILNKADRHVLVSLQVAKMTDSVSSYYDNLDSYNLFNLSCFDSMSEILATGRCFWNNQLTEPLKLGPLKPLNFEWKVDSLGRYAFLPSVSIILPFRDPWYIDIESCECGPLQTDLSRKMILSFLNSPKIPLEEIDQFSKTLINKTKSTSGLILPPQLPPEEILQIDPKPRLRIYGESRIFDSYYHPKDAGVVPLIELGFIYQGIEIPIDFPKKEIHRIVKDKYLKVIRNIEKEKEFLQVLLKQPLSTLGTLFPHERFFPAYANTLSFFPEQQDKAILALKSLIKGGWAASVESTFPCDWIDEADEWFVDLEESSNDSNWFDIELGVMINGEKINLIPILLNVLEQPNFSLESLELVEEAVFSVQLPNGKIIGIPKKRFIYIIKTLLELHDSKNKSIRLPRIKAAELLEWEAQITDKKITWRGAESLHSLGKKLQNSQNIPIATLPTTLKATLRPYQQTGLSWLQFLRENKFGGILADDMGLGKTIQTLSLLLLEKEQGRMHLPCLIVAPKSLMSNWESESVKFTPLLKVLILQGMDRKEHFEDLKKYDLILTTYPLLARDQDVLLKYNYYYLILDEAQFIKNTHAKATQIASLLQAEHKLCLSGTPMENHLGELWSLFHFISPGLLGNQKQFTKFFRTPIEKQNNKEQKLRLSKRVAPFLLRRLKEEVAKELPPKTEIIHRIALEKDQRDLYETIRISMHEKVKNIVQEKGLSKSQIIILDALLKLRQVCCDPRLVKLEAAKSVTSSEKLNFLFNLLEELFQENRKVLLFSSFTSMIALIEEGLVKRNIQYAKLTGETQNRKEVVETFQSGKVPLFLLSLKAGGTGLNLTAADTVIHYDPWWNPAAEKQATDRAHRIGQEKPVFVYKLITEGTIEEKILKLQEKKQALINNLFEEGEGSALSLTAEDLEELFRPIEG